MKWFNIHKIGKVILHIVFWCAVWLFYAYFFSYNTDDKTYVILFPSIIMPATMTVTYFMIYYLIPRYLLTKKYFQFALYCFYTFVFSTNIILPLIFICYIVLAGFNINNMPLTSKNVVFILILVYLIVGIVSFFNLLKNNLKTQSRYNELQGKILETQLKLKEQELQYLKMQIHPHFLFNTLNTIYGLALKQSKHTSEVILMLSNLLDYILYQINKPRVSLKEEVMHIQEYIGLEKIRFQDHLRVEIEVGEISGDAQIAPMMLLPFVENAFKHGSILNGSLSVELKIECNEDQLNFSIRNSFLNDESKTINGGIGLENTKKRLDLNFNNQYSLENLVSNNWYIVNLRIFNLNHNADV